MFLHACIRCGDGKWSRTCRKTFANGPDSIGGTKNYILLIYFVYLSHRFRHILACPPEPYPEHAFHRPQPPPHREIIHEERQAAFQSRSIAKQVPPIPRSQPQILAMCPCLFRTVFVLVILDAIPPRRQSTPTAIQSVQPTLLSLQTTLPFFLSSLGPDTSSSIECIDMESLNILSTELLMNASSKVDGAEYQEHVTWEDLQELKDLSHRHILHRRPNLGALSRRHAFANLLSRVGGALNKDERNEPDIAFRDADVC